MNYSLHLTTIGASKLASAIAGGDTVTLSQMVFSSSPPTFIGVNVSGVLNPDVTGYYQRIGVINGKPAFQHTNGHSMDYSNPVWKILPDDGDGYFQTDNNDFEFPDEATWIPGVGGASGTPQVQLDFTGTAFIDNVVGTAEITSVQTEMNKIILTGILGAAIGGFLIRGIFIQDIDGDVIAAGIFPETYKPIGEEGSASELKVVGKITLNDAESAVTYIDEFTPNVYAPLAGDNTWTGSQTYNGDVEFNGNVTAPGSALTDPGSIVTLGNLGSAISQLGEVARIDFAYAVSYNVSNQVTDFVINTSTGLIPFNIPVPSDFHSLGFFGAKYSNDFGGQFDIVLDPVSMLSPMTICGVCRPGGSGSTTPRVWFRSYKVVANGGNVSLIFTDIAGTQRTLATLPWNASDPVCFAFSGNAVSVKGALAHSGSVAVGEFDSPGQSVGAGVFERNKVQLHSGGASSNCEFGLIRWLYGSSNINQLAMIAQSQMSSLSY